jgi:alpha-ketoglutarate-dependent taurine dioxygenase
MILIEKNDFISIEEIKNNPDKYKEIYLKNKIIVFNNAHLNKDEQTELMIFFGDLFGWFPNSLDTHSIEYIEDHHKHMNDEQDVGKDELMLGWHQEHVQDDDDCHLGATWRMEKFECPEDSGHTYFVDMTAMFESLTTEDQDFLLRCKNMLNTIEYRYEEAGIKEVPVSKEFDIVKNHPLTGEKTIRVSYDSKQNSLSQIDGRKPTQEEEDRYNKLVSFICQEVLTNTDIRMVLKWNQGDLAVPDLFKLAHAVSGGFIKNQRTLSGQFGKAKPWQKRTQ